MFKKLEAKLSIEYIKIKILIRTYRLDSSIEEYVNRKIQVVLSKIDERVSEYHGTWNSGPILKISEPINKLKNLNFI